ncbi:Uncharacterised protein [Mycobacteroides abscessus subsp. abscessus]|nr:Uncharacterised protein [Mycobacteroides abscessus subsp. abscessus]
MKKSSLKEDQWAVAPLVQGPTGKATWPKATAGWGVAASAKNKPEAVKLVHVEMTSKPEVYLSCEEPRGVAWWTEWMQRSQADLQKVLTEKLSTSDALKGWDEFWTKKWKG